MKPRLKEVISMKKTIIIGFCMTVAMALIGTAALALGPGFGHGFGPGYGAGPGSSYPAIPNLTADQSTRIKALHEAFLKENDSLQKEMASKGAELRFYRITPGSDAAAIKAKQDEFFGLRTRLQEKMNNLRAEVQKVLKPEQLAKLPAFAMGRGFGPDSGFGPHMMGPRGRW
jgi:Spy/CpxP family protein refolding chaperone